MPKKLISIVVPCYNEEACAPALGTALMAVFAANKGYDFEAILVDNGSSDRTWELLQAQRARDKRFKLLRLMRNFTADGGIAAGLARAKGDAAFIVYADLQDPPELIGRFLEKWEQGYQNVYGVILTRQDGFIRSLNAGIFYRMMDKLTAGMFPRNVGDFRLVDRQVYEAVNRMPEHNRILRGLFAWTGARSVGVPYERRARLSGESKSFTGYSINFALNAIFGFSYIPITMLTGLGFALAAAAVVAIVVVSVKFIFWGVPFDGFGTIVGLLLLLFGCAFMVLGVIGRYISMIYEDVKGRPNFIAMDEAGFSAPKRRRG